MAISSINIQPATAHSFAHNDRSDKVTYLVDSSKENECSAPAPVAQKALEQMIKDAEQYRKDNGQRALRADTIKAVEAVVNLNASHNLADVQRLSDKIEAEFGFRTVQIAVHRDEGKDKQNKNYHAHIVMCNLSKEGTTIQRTLGRDGLKKLQDLTARELGMERGKSSDAKHIDHKIYRVIAKEKEMLLEKVEELQKENDQLRYNFRDTQKQISALQDLDAEQKKELHRLNTEINKTKDGEDKDLKIEDLKKQLETVRSLRSSDREKIATLEAENTQLKSIPNEVQNHSEHDPKIFQKYADLEQENKLLKVENKGLERENMELKETKSATVLPTINIEEIEEIKKLQELAPTIKMPELQERKDLSAKLQKANAIDEIAKSCYKKVEEKGIFTTTTKTVFDSKAFIGKIKEREADHQKLHSLNDKMSIAFVEKIKSVAEIAKKGIEALKSKFMGKSLPEQKKERTEQLQHTLNNRSEILRDAQKEMQGFLDKLEKDKEPKKSQSMGLSR